MLTATKHPIRPFTAAGLALALLAGLPAQAQETPKPARIFSDDTVLAITIDGPWKEVMRRKEQQLEWPGTVRYTEAGGAVVEIPVTLSTRGLTRLRVCDFPPLRIDFDQEASRGTAFRGAGNLKLVTHCLASTRFEQYYIKEYLAYRIYNLVTPLSFRVQGLDVRYVDGERGGKPIERFAFLIEDPDDVARRNDLEKLDIAEIRPGRLDPLETSRFMLFQYLISNLDWSVLGGPKERCCHNARLVGAGPDAPIVHAIPYDLDSAGLVDAHYAAPPAAIRVRNVRQRLYRGFCAHNDALPAALEEFRALQGEIIGLFENESRLDTRERGKAIKFLNDFYRALAGPDDVQARLIDNCRG